MQAFIIRLQENPHSCIMAKECYDQAVKHGLQPEFFRAIHGKDVEEHYEKTGLRKARKFKKNRIGVLGCFFSHYYLWQKCIELNKPIVILEHDGYFIKPINESILDTFTDVLKLDRLDPYSKSYNSLIEQESNTPIRVEKYKNPKPKKIEDTGNYFKGAYSYIIKPQAARKLVNWITHHGHLPADQQIGDKIVMTMTTVPTVARLHPFYSEGDNINSSSLTKNL